MAASVQDELVRYLQGLPLGLDDAKAVRNFILRRSLLLEGGGRGPLAEMVNVFYTMFPMVSRYVP